MRKVMRGFFSLQTPGNKRRTVDQRRFRIGVEPNCKECGLDKKARSPMIQPSGKGQKGILGYGEAPGEREDIKAANFQGDAGDKLAFHCRKYGYLLHRDFFLINAINCRPTKEGRNRKPRREELVYCRPLVEQYIQELRPKYIILMGGVAVSSFLMDRSGPIKNDSSITRWRGQRFPDTKSGAWVYVVNHPSFVLHQPDAEHVFSRDLGWALEDLRDRPPPVFPNWKEQIELITDYDQLMALLRRIAAEKPAISLDYETTGLKPFQAGHKIVATSIGLQDMAYSFPISHPLIFSDKEQQGIVEWLRIIIEDPEIEMTSHNIQMEERWHRTLYGIYGRGWVWDTMQAAHIIDERHKTTSLAMQVFLNWGYEYGGMIDPYKKGFPFNRMMETSIMDLLEYSALDARFTYLLPHLQQDRMALQSHDDLTQAYNLWHESVLTFCDLETEGMVMDKRHYEKADRQLSRRVSFIRKRLDNSREARLFRETKEKPLDYDSPTQLRTLFYDILNTPVYKTTDKLNPSVDESVLEMIGSQFCRDIIKMRKMNKNLRTYVGQYMKEIIEISEDGFGPLYKMFPFFNLHLVRTYRSSSDSPNFQNIPKRDEDSKKLIRSGILPLPGYRVGAVDYGSMEVRIIACYFDDPVLIHECQNDIDPHGTWAKELGLDKQAQWELARYDSKNGFVFPLFYGSYYGSIHKDLIGRGYDLSEADVQKVEKMFWEKYEVTRRNQFQALDHYQSTGYIRLMWGHRRRGLLNRNKIFNTPIQGSAFHCLLWSLNEANRIRKEEQWESRIPGQIHDEIFLYLHPNEEKHIIETITRIMTEDIREACPWIKVPLLAEWSTAPIDQPWYYIEDIKDIEAYLDKL